MKIKDFYKENGYVVVRNLIDKLTINKFLNIFSKEIVFNHAVKLPRWISKSIQDQSLKQCSSKSHK